jgi:dephospho-CoA kinase
MLKVALTGGIGSGKSTASAHFSTLGIDIIDADVIAHQLTAPGSDIEQNIIDHFGADCVTTNGVLDRKKCRDIVFQDTAQRHWLEQLLHPLIRQEIQHGLNVSRSAYSIAVIPLLFESGHYPSINRICVVDIDAGIQRQRAMLRDHTTEDDIKRIQQAQAQQQQRLAIADDIIYNNGNLEQLKQRVEELHQLYLNLGHAH